MSSVANLNYLHPSLCIPSHVMDDLLPDPSLSILEFLEYKLPIISSSKTLAPAKFFSKLEPTISDVALIRGMVVPSKKTLKDLGKMCMTAVEDGAASLCIHNLHGPEKCVPLWTLPYWMEASELRRGHRLWSEAYDCLQERQGSRKGKCSEETQNLIEDVWSSLGNVPWYGTTRGFTNREPLSSLAAYATQRWLSDVHENQMLDLLRADIRLDPSKPQVSVKGTHFVQKLREAYSKRDMEYAANNQAFGEVHTAGVGLGDGMYDQLGCLLHEGGDHWVAIIIDSGNNTILYSDSFSGEMEEELKDVLHWWTHCHTGRDFSFGTLVIT